MLGGLYGLNKKQHLCLITCLVTPTASLAYCILALNDGLLALIMVNTLYITLPYVYINFFSKEAEVGGT